MAFRVKDLMIHVLPSEPEIAARGIGCGNNCSYGECTRTCQQECSYNCSGCTVKACSGGCSNCSNSYCGWPSNVAIAAASADPQQLAMLKAHLKQALENVERQEQALEESMRPQSVADIEKLEAKLNEALVELKTRKDELKKRPSKKSQSPREG